MNQLFFYAGALDATSNHSKLLEFYRLDKEIEQWYDTYSYKELFHSFEFACMNARAKNILRQLQAIN